MPRVKIQKKIQVTDFCVQRANFFELKILPFLFRSMLGMFQVLSITIAFLIGTTTLQAQNPALNKKYKVDPNQVFLLPGSESLVGRLINGEQVNIITGNVKFSQGNVFLFCDSAYQYDDRNEVICFGKVRMTQGDTIQLTGKKLHYFGTTGRAIVTDNVVLKDRQMTLTTNYMDYDTKTKIASYKGGGKIIDKDNILTSEQGYYSTASKIFWFKKNVVVVNTKEESTLTSDTLEYNSNNGIATFRGPSKVVKKNDILYADHGQYDTRKAQSIFTGRAKVETGDYIMEGDRLFYDDVLKAGAGEGKVILYSRKNKIIILGDEVRYWGKNGVVKVYGKPLMKNPMEKDTLYLTADTLVSIDRKLPSDTTKQEKYLLAYKSAKLFRGEMQGICDSLVYNQLDSVVHFFTKPTLWNGKNQIIADSIRAYLKKGTIHRVECVSDAMVISQDTVLNFNQVSGKYITAYFHKDKISLVNVRINARTLYYPLDDKKNNQVVGMNRADCSSINVNFKEGKFSTVTYLKKPDAKMIPLKEVKEEEKTLEGFEWRYKLRPLFSEVGGLRPPQGLPFIPGSPYDSLSRLDSLSQLDSTNTVATTDSSVTDVKVDKKEIGNPEISEDKKDPKQSTKIPDLTEKQKRRLARKEARKNRKAARKKKRAERKTKKNS